MLTMMRSKGDDPTRTNCGSPRRLTYRLPYSSRKWLLTPGERRFFHQGLKPAVGERYLIAFKARLADVITVADWEGPHGRRIAHKHLDFVLIACQTTRIVAAVELNDASHNGSDHQQRDAFVFNALRAAGIPLVAFPVYQEYDPRKIRKRLLTAIHSQHRERTLPERGQTKERLLDSSSRPIIWRSNKLKFRSHSRKTVERHITEWATED